MAKDPRVYRGYGRRRYSGRITFIITLLIVLLVLAAGLFFWFRQGTASEDEPYLGERYDKNQVTGTLSASEATSLNFGQEFTYMINGKPAVKGKKANLRLENPVENTLLMQVTITLNDSSEIYRSGLIKPYHYIEYVSLNKSLSKGEHKAVAKISAIDPLDESILVTSEQELLLLAE